MKLHEDPSLQALKHFVDIYTHPSKLTPEADLRDHLPILIRLEILQAAVRYANDRSHALDAELQQLRSRIAEKDVLRRGSTVLEREDNGLRPSDWWIDVAMRDDLRKCLLQLIVERGTKWFEMVRLRDTLVDGKQEQPRLVPSNVRQTCFD